MIAVTVISFMVKEINNWQQFILRAIFSVSMAMALSSLSSGFLHINLKGKFLDNKIKIIAAGSFAVLILFYLINPTPIV